MTKDVTQVKENTDTDNGNKIRHNRNNEKSSFNSVVLVQAAVCAFFILLVFLAWKFSPSTFEFLRSEFNRIMSIDMTTDELIESAKDSAQSVMGSLTPEETAATDSTDKLNGTGGEDREAAAVAVMAGLGKNDQITVPLHGRITSRYGYRTNPISGKYGLHTGVDIAADEGTIIVAAYNGVVRDTGYGNKKGNYVLMEHSDGTETLYCHCSEVLVDEGTVIRAGESIALVGSTGWSTGPHLHFEIHNKSGWSTDPMQFMEENDGRV